MIEHALEIAARGVRIFPCHPATKRPLTAHGFKDATTDLAVIKQWWSNDPQAMMGRPTGDGYFVLDIDLPDGPASLQALEDECGLLPPTTTTRTPGGGLHMFFTSDRSLRNTASRIGVNLDIRGDGGYVILAGSVNAEGKRYEAIDSRDPTEAPAWLVDKATASKGGQTKRTDIVKPPAARRTTGNSRYGAAVLGAECRKISTAPEGVRNAVLNEATFLIATLIAGGEVEESEAVAALQASAEEVGLSTEEIEKTIHSGMEAGKQTPRKPNSETHYSAFALGSGAEISEWSEPLPLITRQQVDPYPVDALPGIIGAAVREVQSFVQAPVALAACSALSAISTVVQGLANVRRADKLEGPVSLYMLAIADSGERKSSVDGHFTSSIKRWETNQSEKVATEVIKYETEMATWAAKQNGLTQGIQAAAKAGKDTGVLERSMTVLSEEKPESPKIPRLIYGDATPEALAFKLANGWPVGGVLSSEAGVVFGAHGMGADSAMRNMATLNSLWSDEPITIDRKTSASFSVRNKRLTMGLAVQVEAVRAFVDGSKGLARGIGFLARFLMAWPPSTQGSRMFREPPDHWPHLASFHRRMDTLLDLPLNIDGRGELSPVMLELSKEAKAMWVSFHDSIEVELRPGRDMAETRDVASKAADNCARLAAIFHVFEDAQGDSIGDDHMRSAIAITTWHLYEARRFMGEIALPVEVDHSVKLNGWLIEFCRENKVSEITTREIQRLGPGCLRGSRTLGPALDELIDTGRVVVVKDGRKKNVRINPILLGIPGGDLHGAA